MTTRSTELLQVVHRTPGVTRADAARALGVGTGAATELVTKLSRASLLVQGPAAPSGTRGRPTTVLLPHPEGPLALAISITHESWRIDVVELGGTTAASRQGRNAGADWPQVHAALRTAIHQLRLLYGHRLRAIGVSAPGTVTTSTTATTSTTVTTPAAATPAAATRDVVPTTSLATSRPPRAGSTATTPDTLASGTTSGGGSRSWWMNATTAGWLDVDLTTLYPDAEVFVAGNDATLAAAAESHRGAAVGASVALHLRIEAGLGGAVVEDGRPVTGARGAAGEYGHMPFGDPSIPCACGASGCWGMSVDGTALARHLKAPPPVDPISYARRVIATAVPALPALHTLLSAPTPPPPGTPPNSVPGKPATPLPGTPPGPCHVAPPLSLEVTPPVAAPGYPQDGTPGTPLPGKAEENTAGGQALDRANVQSAAPLDIDPAAAAEAVRAIAASLGRGIAGLVNGLDPDLVTLGGLGVDLLAAVPDEIQSAYRAGLMSIHRDSPPPIVPALLGENGPIAGAAAEAWTALLPHLA
ncbi:ROK family protein [Actinoplanes sp. NPDC051851]|uniref:ROK family protein n=1 Tax=Actinoplanes sp. NPDC051851 TaxID=3154753 RepID=UPI00343F9B3B